MNVYKGLKSEDAEIVLDLENGKVFFDYSLNQFANILNSNSSCVLSESKEGTALKRKIMEFAQIFVFWAYIISIPIGIVSACFPSSFQYKWQKWLKFCISNTLGLETQTLIGRCNTKETVHIKNNVWFDYNLDGDYQTKIKKISLLRHFTLISRCGTTQHIQRGWDVVFEFKDVPENGYCVVRSLL